MAITTFTFTGNVDEVEGSVPIRTYYTIEMFGGSNLVVFTVENEERVFGGRHEATDGAWSVTLPHTNITGANPTTFQYKVTVEAVVEGKAEPVILGPAVFSAPTGTTSIDFADQLSTIGVSPTYESTVFQAARDAAAASATAAAASAATATTKANEASTLVSEFEASGVITSALVGQVVVTETDPALITNRIDKALYLQIDPLPALTPGQLGALAWVKASTLVGPLADGAAVASWTDSSGAGHSPAQATEAKKPILRYNAAATGKAGVEFDGTDDVLKAAQWSQPELNAGLLVGGVFRLQAGTASVLDSIVAGTTVDDKVMQQFYRRADALTLAAFATVVLPSTTTLADNTLYRVVVEFRSGQNTRVYLNNVLVVEGSTGTFPTATSFIIGNNNNENGAMKGHVFEAFLIPGLHAKAKLDQLDKYLTDTYF